MSKFRAPEMPLYSFECRNEYLDLAQSLHDEHLPETPEEIELWDTMVSAAWLRARYEKVRSRLYDRKVALANTQPGSPKLQELLTSIQHFQREVEKQRRIFNSSRKALARMRESGFPLSTTNLEENDNDFAQAA